MTSLDASELQRLFRSLPPPSGGEDWFSALPVPGSDAYKIGRDGDGSPCLLIATAGHSPADRLPPFKLEKLWVQHDLLCRVSNHTDSSDPTEGRFTVVRCTDDSLAPYFLKICASITATLGSYPRRDEISVMVGRLAELFQAISRPPRESVQGLWAELFLIATSRDPLRLVEAWHAEPEERFDFALEEERVEVKSASGHERKHHFALEQIRPAGDVVVVIASVFLDRVGGGCSLGELIDRIQARLGQRADLSFHLDRVVGITLGAALRRGLEERFDLGRAEQSLAFYPAAVIPSVSPQLPMGVSGVRFVADLSGVDSLDRSELRQQGVLFRTLP